MGAPEIALVGAGTGGDREPLVAELARRLSALGYLPTVIDLLSVVPAPVAATVRLRYAMTARRAPQAGPAPSRLGVAGRAAVRALRRGPVPASAVVVATHPLAARAAGWLRTSGLLPAPLVTYVDRLTVDRSWFAPGTDLYLVPHPITAAQARHDGATRVAVVAPPVPALPTSTRAQLIARARLGVPGGVPMPLLVSGGRRDGRRVEQAAVGLAAAGIRPLVATGDDDALRARLLAHRGCLAIPHTPALVPTLLSACDLVVAPRPDATLLRARAAGRPTIVYRPASDADRAEAEAWRTAEWAIPVSGPELLAEMVRAALERGTARPVVPGADPAPLIAGLADVPELVELPVVDAGPIG